MSSSTGIGLPQIGGFRDRDGYDGVFLAVPGTGAHLELTAGGGHGAPTPHPESLLVFYLGDEATVQAVAARLSVAPVPPANPYWAEDGLTLQDPDGFRVVLVPEHWEPSARGATSNASTPGHSAAATYEGAMGTPTGDVLTDNTATAGVRAQA